jgi:hypothetical protein
MTSSNALVENIVKNYRNCFPIAMFFWVLPTEILRSWGLVIYRWKGLVKIFPIKKSQQQSFFTLV